MYFFRFYRYIYYEWKLFILFDAELELIWMQIMKMSDGLLFLAISNVFCLFFLILLAVSDVFFF